MRIMPAMKTEEVTDTKERLIEAGMEVFAERGYADAGIREICRRADANPAAVNYHFGDKQRFYAEVLVTCHQRTVARRDMPRLANDPGRPEKVLRSWIRWFLELLLFDASHSPLGKLMTREMVDPTPAFDELVRRSILPMNLALHEAVEALLPGVEPRRVMLSVQSVLGQCLLYKHAQPALERFERLYEAGVLPGLGPTGFRDFDALAEHIADFSLAGLRQVAAGANGDPP